MSGSQPPQGPLNAGTTSGSDPSMEDILASIRRILSEDEVPARVNAQPQEPADDGVLVLDPSMMVQEPAPVAEEVPVSEPVHTPELPTAELPAPAGSALVAPEAAAAAASSVSGLVRTLAQERHTLVRTGGPTIEDLVREEIRPLLKVWLDTNLPPLVERLVRAEIERVVGRAEP
jgi:cell pole-organizing protein PopZ